MPFGFIDQNLLEYSCPFFLTTRRFVFEHAPQLPEANSTSCDVYEPYLHEESDEGNQLSQEYKDFAALGLTHNHFYKIRMAEVVFVYNKDGYIGNSTTLEIGFAVALGKPIYALSDADEEICRKVLFSKVVKTPEELIKELS